MFFALLAGTLAPCFARAESAADILSKVKAGGFTCTGISGGSFCVSQDKKVNILIPSTDSPIQSAVMYAHGNRGPCPEGLSGENFLKDQMKPLGEHCAMAVLPDRADPQGEGFPLDKYTQDLDKLLGSKLNLLVGGHSSGGHAIAQALARFCGSQPSRVKDIGWFDAGYNPGDAELLKQGLKSCKFKMAAVASTTLGTTNQQANAVNAAEPGTAQVTPVSDDHCRLPKQHFAKMLGKNSCRPPKQDKPVARREPQQPDPGYAQPPPPGASPPASYPVAASPSPAPLPAYAEGAQYPTPLAAPALPVGSASGPAARASPPFRAPAGMKAVLQPGQKEQTQDLSTITRNGDALPPSGSQRESAEYPTAGGKQGGLSSAGSSRAHGAMAGGSARESSGESGGASRSASGSVATPAKAAGEKKEGESDPEGVNQGGGVRNFGRAPGSVPKQFAASATLGGPAIPMAEEGKNLYDEIDRIQEQEFRPAAALADDESLFTRARRAHVRHLQRGNVAGGSL